MNRCLELLLISIAGLLISAAVGAAAEEYAGGGLGLTAQHMSGQLRDATVVCKLRLEGVVRSEEASPNGTKCAATCPVISVLQGSAGEAVSIVFLQPAFGSVSPDADDVHEGNVYLVLLSGESPPYTMSAAMRALPEVVEPTFGESPADRIVAELAAMCRSNDPELQHAAIRQLGKLKDPRAAELINAAAGSDDPQIVRAGVIAQYRLKLQTDVKQVMRLFDADVLDALAQESTIPVKNADGSWQYRMHGHEKIMERGLSEFDYATFVREGIRFEFVRADETSLNQFFHIPWVVQRQECVPELVTLLDHPDSRVRWWAALCLTHTIENRDSYSPPEQRTEKQLEPELKKWKVWWQEKGSAFMNAPTPVIRDAT